MANPSTGFGGAGTEVIRRSYIDNQGETEGTIITGVANHIMTVISIIVTDMVGLADNQFDIYIDYDLGGTDVWLLNRETTGHSGTFVFSDRFSITETDKLHIKGYSASSTAGFDVWCTYIDQQLA